MKKKLKRIEWLNLYSKGFVVESINNNYNNEDILINRKNKLDKKHNSNINFYKEKNIIFEKVESSKASNNKKVISDDKTKYYYLDLSELVRDSNNKKSKKEASKKSKKVQNKKRIKKNKSTININFINIEQNIILKKSEKKNDIKIKKREIKNQISSPLLNYLNLQKQRQNENKISRKAFNKNNNNNKIILNNTDANEKTFKNEKINLNLNLCQYINNKGIKLRHNNIRNKNVINNDTDKKELGDIGDYTFDDESLIITEENNMNDFSEICNTTNNVNIRNKNKKGLNIFFTTAPNNKDFKMEKVEEIKNIINCLKK